MKPQNITGTNPLEIGNWLSLSNLSSTHGFFMIAIKGSEMADSACSLANLKYLVLELGIPSGIDEKPITFQVVKLNFDDCTSLDDPELDAKTACAKIGPMPSTIYLRAIAFSDGDTEYKSGKMPVSINILPF